MSNDNSSAGNSSARKDTANYATILISYIKSIISFKGNIISLATPAPFLSGISLLELGADWGDYTDLLNEIPNGKTSSEKMLLVAKWALSSFHASYFGIKANGGVNVKKPYNPILGERFYCEWPHEKFGTTKLTCEQVSHHPPVSAFSLENEQNQIICNGYSGQKIKFAGTTMNVDQEGQMSVLLKKTNELFVMSLPSLSIGGLITGSPFIELHGTVFIKSNNGTTCTLEFFKKPWLYGEYYKFNGYVINDLDNDYEPDELLNILKVPKGHEALDKQYIIDGSWTKKSSFIYVGPTSSSGNDVLDKDKDKDKDKVGENGDDYDHDYEDNYEDEDSVSDLEDRVRDIAIDSKDFVDFEQMTTTVSKRTPIDSQSELESQRVWRKVTEALTVYDYSTAAQEKNDIEEAQRAKRKQEKLEGKQWTPQLFTFVKYSDIKNEQYKSTFESVFTVKPSVTGGFWVQNHLVDSFSTPS